MEPCSRCQRKHNGVCGIPPGVTLGFGARSTQATVKQPEERVNRVRDSRQRKPDLLLDWVLDEGRRREQEITEMLRKLQAAGLTKGVMPEFDRLIQQLDEVREIVVNATKASR